MYGITNHCFMQLRSSVHVFIKKYIFQKTRLGKFALIENEHRTRQALRATRAMLREENPQANIAG